MSGIQQKLSWNYKKILSFIIGKSIQIAIYDSYIARFDKDLKIIINIMLKTNNSQDHVGGFHYHNGDIKQSKGSVVRILIHYTADELFLWWFYENTEHSKGK